MKESSTTSNILRDFVAYLIRVVHHLVVIFNLFCPFINNIITSWIFVIFVPTMILQWHLLDNRCILTIWEYRLRTHQKNKELEGAFLKSLIENLGVKVSDNQLKYALYTYLIGAWFVCIYRIIELS